MGGEVPSDGLLVLLGGGIGAGKSSIGAIFADRGFRVIEADTIGHGLLAGDDDVRSAIASRWPDVIDDGVIDRRRLATIVFADRHELDALEAITHPRIVEAIHRQVADGGPARVVVETPVPSLGIEGSGMVRIAVVADRDLRLARAVSRGGDPVDVARRMDQQVGDDTWIDWADVVIDNGGPWAETQRRVTAVIEGLVRDA